MQCNTFYFLSQHTKIKTFLPNSFEGTQISYRCAFQKMLPSETFMKAECMIL